MRINIIAPVKSRFNLRSAAREGLGGIETACIELSRALAARGHKIALITTTEEAVEEPGVQNVGFGDLNSLESDVSISCNDPRPLERARGASVLWMHNPIAIEKAARRGYLSPLWRLRPHAVFGSRTADQDVSQLYPFASRETIPLGISGEFLAARIDLPRSTRFIWASQPQRGLKAAATAWLRAFPDMPAGSEFRVFGSGAAEAGVTDVEARASNIVFAPRADKAALAKCHETSLALICLGAPDETFCLAAAEAQCVGLPVITMGIGALAERVSHGVNGLVVADASELSSAMVRLARDSELTSLLRRGALTTREMLSWARSAKLWENYLTRFTRAT